MKKASALLAIGGILALTGVGCSSGNPETPSPTSTEENTNSTTTLSVPVESASSGEFSVTVEKSENGVSVKWTAPSDLPKTDAFRVLHSARQNVIFGANQTLQPFWWQYSNDARSTDLSNVPKGKRYFRVCEYNLDKQECVKYSNEVEFQVE